MSENYSQDQFNALRDELNRVASRERNQRVAVTQNVAKVAAILTDAFAEENWTADRESVTIPVEAVTEIARLLNVAVTHTVEVTVNIEGTVTMTVPLWIDEDDAYDQLSVDSDGTICANDDAYEVQSCDLDLSRGY